MPLASAARIGDSGNAMNIPNPVIDVAPAKPEVALAHFSRKLEFETDCADVHYGLSLAAPGFVLLDARSPRLYKLGHVGGAVNAPTRTIDAGRMAEYPAETVFVVYCAGPHCNGATKAAIRLAALGRPVKEMIGGVTGWIDEGYELTKAGA